MNRNCNYFGTYYRCLCIWISTLYGQKTCRNTAEYWTENEAKTPYCDAYRLAFGAYHNRADEFRKWIDTVNKEQPEAVLIGGDIIDRSIRAINEQNMAAEFKRLKAPVYACLGNHEYYSGEPKAKQFYKEAGINLLIDNHALVPLKGGDTLLVIGRDDRTNMRRGSA